MKIIIREWRKSPIALGCLTANTILNIVYAGLDDLVVALIAAAFTAASSGIPWRHILILIGISAIMSLISTINDVTWEMSSNYLFTGASNRYMDKVLDAEYEFFMKNSVSRVATIAEFIGKISKYGQSMATNIVGAGNLIIRIGFICALAGWMGGLVVLIHAVAVVLIWKLFQKYAVYDKEANDYRHQRNQILENVINAFSEIRIFRTQEYYQKQFHELNQKTKDTINRRTRISALVTLVIEVSCAAAWISILIYGCYQIQSGVITAATALAVITYEFRIISPLMNIVNFVDEFLKEKNLGQEFDAMMNYQNGTVHTGTVHLNGFHHQIQVKDLGFCYSESDQILQDVNLTIPKGKKIGICGGSGNGKSTLMKLLNQFYHPTRGSIRMDGIDIRKFDIDSYRKLFGSVQQDNAVFPGTILENLMIANPHADLCEVNAALQRAHLYDFVISLPHRLETIVGPNGYTLSGGQIQRIALARLFLQNPEIILLDEATSALDNETENFVQEALGELEDKTVITIAHRLSTIQDSDIIYVISDHTIAESGTHEELLARHGIYWNMWNA